MLWADAIVRLESNPYCTHTVSFTFSVFLFYVPWFAAPACGPPAGLREVWWHRLVMLPPWELLAHLCHLKIGQTDWLFALQTIRTTHSKAPCVSWMHQQYWNYPDRSVLLASQSFAASQYRRHYWWHSTTAAGASRPSVSIHGSWTQQHYLSSDALPTGCLLPPNSTPLRCCK